jgi:hypothetical protein
VCVCVCVLGVSCVVFFFGCFDFFFCALSFFLVIIFLILSHLFSCMCVFDSLCSLSFVFVKVKFVSVCVLGSPLHFFLDELSLHCIDMSRVTIFDALFRFFFLFFDFFVPTHVDTSRALILRALSFFSCIFFSLSDELPLESVDMGRGHGL